MANILPPLQADLLDTRGKLTEPWMRYFQSIGIIQGHGSTPLLSNATPLTNGIASSGIVNEASRADHVHPTDITRASKSDLDVLQEQFDSIAEFSNATGPTVAPLYYDNGDGTFNLGNGTYSLYDNAKHEGNPREYALFGRVFEPTDGVTSYVVAKYLTTGPILAITTDVEIINESDICPIITVFRDGTTLYKLHWDTIGAGKVDKLHQAEVKTNRFRLESGLKITTTGISAGYGISEGRVWYGAAKQNVSTFDSTVDTTYLVYHDGTNWVKSPTAGYNINYYNNAGVLAFVSNNKYAVSFIYRSLSDHKMCYVIPANADYKLIEADKAQPPLFWELPGFIKAHSILVGRIISPAGLSIPISITSAFDAQFTGSMLGIHNELSGRDVIDCHPAASITNTPAGNIVSTNVQAAINELDTDLTTEINARIDADNTLSSRITTEVNDRISADNTLSTRITNEVNDRIAADTTLSNRITTEVNDRIAADTTLNNRITTEVNDRITADTALENKKVNKVELVTLGATFVTNQPFRLINDVAMPITSIDIDSPFIDGIILSSGSTGDIREAGRVRGFEYSTILGLPSGPVLYLSQTGLLTDVVPTISASDKWSYVIARNTDNINGRRFIIETTKPILLV